MTFEFPFLLWGLLLVPLAVAAYVLAQRRRSQYAVRFTNLDLLASVVHRSPGWRRHIPAAFYVLALTALLISLARPQAVVPVPREQATVMLVMDVSGSMDATDVEPTRMIAAQQAAGSFLDQLPEGFQVGLVSFSSTAQTLTVPTRDRNTVRHAIDQLRSGGGTAMGDGLARALEYRETADTSPTPVPSPTGPAFPPRQGTSPAPVPGAPESGEQVPFAVVLLSDGANTAGRISPLQAAQYARDLDVPVFTIALGTQDGTLTMTGPGGRPRVVAVPPDEQTLQQIAEISGGRFFSAPSDDDLRVVYRDLSRHVGFEDEQHEVTALFAGAALALMLAGGTMALLWFNRFP
jgi:Ca-activated chloride channel homolog